MKKHNLKAIMLLVSLMAALAACSSSSPYKSLQDELEAFAKLQDADIGIAVIIDGKDTASVNGDRQFPMLSVYKLPIAMALAEEYRSRNLDFTESVVVTRADLHPDTYSPMTEWMSASGAMTRDSLEVTTREILKYMLQQSDNNASDLALKCLRGPDNAMRLLDAMGLQGVNIVSTEDQMHRDTSLCRLNSTSPLAMARLLDRLDAKYDDALSNQIKQLMETCQTGANRLAKPLASSGAVVGHKTGTGFKLANGGIMAVNDAGYVHLPDGRRYSIAVFIADSPSSLEDTEGLIASVSGIVMSYMLKR